MNFVIITGLSGAGRSVVLKDMEDMGYFCVDNIPPALIPKFAEICSHSQGKIDKVAAVIDSRMGDLIKDLFVQLSFLKEKGHTYEIVYLEASDDTLVKRFKENKRIHPLAPEGRIIEGIKEEKKILRSIRLRANRIIDTTNLSIWQLKNQISLIFDENKNSEGLIISVLSFGFKYGMPTDADLIFDVRFITNPFYDETMKFLTGKDERVKEFVLSKPETQTFLQKLEEMMEFLIPNYIKEGKNQLVIGIGCTGGQHRSVAISEHLYNSLIKNGHKVTIDHRDVALCNRGV